MRPISGSGSMAFDEVVPTVAHTKHGTQARRGGPWRSAAASASGRMAKFSSTSIRRRFSRPRPAILHRLLDRRVRLRRGVGHELPVAAALVAGEIRGALARGQQAHSDALEAVSWMTPPPALGRLKLAAAGRASRPASRARGFPVRCKRGWWPRACPARPARRTAVRPGSTGPELLEGK